MLAALEYHQGQTLKLLNEQGKLNQRAAREYHLLGKDLVKMDALDEKVQARLNKLTTLIQEIETIEELL